jgi:hypothetical protein
MGENSVYFAGIYGAYISFTLLLRVLLTQIGLAPARRARCSQPQAWPWPGQIAADQGAA